MSSIVTVDLSKNQKQYDYFIEVVKACKGITQKRKFAYGGAIRGGKSWVTLFILCYLCRKYPGSKWVVIRKDFTVLQSTTIESLKKMLRGSKEWKWHEERGNYYVERLEQRSRIYFMGENYSRDKELNDFLGLECNGFFLEQLEELTEKLWDISSSRAGSLYLPDMPPAFMFTTFNPTQKWAKEKIYEKSRNGSLPDDFLYMSAMPSDNPYVTQDQWNTWNQMSERYIKQFIEGDWTDFDDTDPRWAFAFEQRHVKDTIPFLATYPVYLGWDFNRDPLACVAVQKSPQMGIQGSFLHWIKEFCEPVQLSELCMQIKATFPSSILFVTGDSSGNKGDIGYDARNETHYKMIQRYLRLSDKQMNLNKSNMEHHDSRLLTNTMLTSYPNEFFSKSGCPRLISEYKNAKVDVNHKNAGHLLKDREENKLDLFDASRYIRQTYFKAWMELVNV